MIRISVSLTVNVFSFLYILLYFTKNIGEFNLKKDDIKRHIDFVGSLITRRRKCLYFKCMFPVRKREDHGPVPSTEHQLPEPPRTRDHSVVMFV